MIPTATVDAIKQKMCAHLRARTQWDELPDLYTLHATGRGLRMSHIPIPAHLWISYGHPPRAVAALAAQAPTMPRSRNGTHLLVRPHQGPLVGLALRYEAYVIRSDSPNPAAAEAARRREAGGSVPPNKDIPGRLEERCMTAVDLDGGRYMASSSRIADGKPDATEPAVHYHPFGDTSRDKLSGNVVDAIIRLLGAITPLPQRNTSR